MGAIYDEAGYVTPHVLGDGGGAGIGTLTPLGALAQEKDKGAAAKEKGSADPEFVVLYYYAKSDPHGTFKYTLYDTRKGEGDPKEAQAWLDKINAPGSKFEGRAYALVLARWPGGAEDEKIKLAIASLRNEWKLEGTVWNPAPTLLLHVFKRNLVFEQVNAADDSKSIHSAVWIMDDLNNITIFYPRNNERPFFRGKCFPEKGLIEGNFIEDGKPRGGVRWNYMRPDEVPEFKRQWKEFTDGATKKLIEEMDRQKGVK